MNFVRSRLSVGSFLGQRCRRVTETWSHRSMCNKPQEVKSEPLPTVPAEAPRAGFRTPGTRPSSYDRKILLWAGRFKTPDQIPEFVSVEMIDAARNKVRVKVCFIMMGATILACLTMVILGKRAARRHDSLTAQNMEKKTKWREELYKQGDTAAAAVVDAKKVQ